MEHILFLDVLDGSFFSEINPIKAKMFQPAKCFFIPWLSSQNLDDFPSHPIKTMIFFDYERASPKDNLLTINHHESPKIIPVRQTDK